MLRGFFMEVVLKNLALACVALLALAGCVIPPPSPVERRLYDGDPLRCYTRAECTTKVSRTLQFVFDYAAAGAPLVQREGRLLFTPEDAPASDWPAVQIELGGPVKGDFALSIECRQAPCRTYPAALQEAYRHYLVGDSCTWQGGLCLPPRR